MSIIQTISQVQAMLLHIYQIWNRVLVSFSAGTNQEPVLTTFPRCIITLIDGRTSVMNYAFHAIFGLDK